MLIFHNKNKTMKITLLIPILFLSFSIIAQEKMITKNGTISFEASVPAFEEVKAKNTGVSCVLNTKTGEIASLALMKGFKFKVALMEEHFNENYVESDRFPKAIFKGKIEGFDTSLITAAPKDFVLNGKLELHGKSVPIKTIAKISKSAAGINLNTTFSVNASDFNIAIPSVVKSKVSNKINIQVASVLK